MSHIPSSRIHAYRKRALDVVVDIDTDLAPEDLTTIVFQFHTVQKSGLTAEAGGSGLEVDVPLAAADLNLSPDNYRWELRADIAGKTRTLAVGALHLDPEPTSTA